MRQKLKYPGEPGEPQIVRYRTVCERCVERGVCPATRYESPTLRGLTEGIERTGWGWSSRYGDLCPLCVADYGGGTKEERDDARQ